MKYLVKIKEYEELDELVKDCLVDIYDDSSIDINFHILGKSFSLRAYTNFFGADDKLLPYYRDNINTFIDLVSDDYKVDIKIDTKKYTKLPANFRNFELILTPKS